MVTTRRACLLWLMFIQTMTLAGHSLAIPIAGDEQSAGQLVIGFGDDDRETAFVVPGLRAAESGGELWELPSLSGVRGSSSADPFWADGVQSSDRWSGLETDAGALPLRAGMPAPGRPSSPSAVTAGATSESAQQPGQTAPAVQIVLDERVVEMARGAEHRLIETLVEVLDVRRTEKAGQLGFSVGAVDGFQVTRSEGGLALGYDGTTLLVSERAENTARSRDQPASSGLSSSSQAPHGSSVVGELTRMFTDLLQYPLFWVVVVLLLAGKIAWLVARHWSAGERRAERRSYTHRRHEHRTTHGRTPSLPPERGRSIAR